MKHTAKGLGSSYAVVLAASSKLGDAQSCLWAICNCSQALFWSFFIFNDTFSLCSSGWSSEDSGILCMAVRLAVLWLSWALAAHPAWWSKRGRSQSPTQVWAAGSRNTHNERKLGTSPLQNQINNASGKKKKGPQKSAWTKSFPFPSPQQQWLAEAEVFSHWKHGSIWELSLQSTNKQNPGSVFHSIVNHSWLSVYVFLHCKGILGPPPKQLVLSARFNLEWQD